MHKYRQHSERSIRAGAATAFLLLATSLLGQTSATKEAPRSMTRAYVAGEPSQSSLLRQLNTSMEALVAKASPAVVQIVVTGYGPVQQKGEDDVAVLAPEKALGSGVVVDP